MVLLRRWAPFLLSVLLLGAVAFVGLQQTGEARARGEAVVREDRTAQQRTMTLLNDSYFGFIARGLYEFSSERTWSLQPGDQRDVAQLSTLVERSLSSEHLGNVLVDRERRTLASVAAAGAELPDLSDPGYEPLFAALQQGRPGVSDVLPAGERFAVAVGVPVMDMGSVQAVLIGLYPVSDSTALSDFTRRLDGGQGSTGYVIDRKGVVVASSQRGLTGAVLPDGAALDAITQAESGLVTVGDDRLVVSFARSGLTGFRTVSLQPESAFYASVRQGLRSADVTVLLLLVVAAVGMAALNERRQRALRRLADEAFIDPLTRLANRARFTQALEHSLMESPANGSVALLYCDLDRFKSVNDTLGHEAGDELLQQVADRLRRCMRAGDVVSRLGGDEFTVVLSGIDSVSVAREAAQRIIDAVREPFDLSAGSLTIGISVGIAIAEPGADLESVLRDADLAMYRSKERGRNRFEIYEDGMRAHAAQHVHVEAELRDGIDRGELRLHYQPVVRLSDRLVMAHEALVRWQRPEGTVLPPAAFLPVAEQSDLILDVGRWVRRQACADLAARLREAPDSAGSVSVNLSVREVHKAPLLVPEIAELLRQHDLPRGALVLEISEGATLDGCTPEVRAAFDELRALGVGIALDDFGAGATTLRHLHQLPLDVVKLDGALIAHVVRDEPAAAVVRSAIALVHDLGALVVAEHVEDQVQADLLQDAGCDYGQGFFFGRPAPLPPAEGEGSAARAIPSARLAHEVLPARS